MLSLDKDFFTPPQDCGQPQAQGNCPGVKHWIVGAGDVSVVEKWVLTDFNNEIQGDPRLVRVENVEGRRVLIYRFPTYPAGGVNGSHIAAFVRVDDQMVFASLHGKEWLRSAVDIALDLARQAAAA